MSVTLRPLCMQPPPLLLLIQSMQCRGWPAHTCCPRGQRRCASTCIVSKLSSCCYLSQPVGCMDDSMMS